MNKLPDREFMAYYKSSLRHSRRVMIIGFIIGGLCMAGGIAKLLLVLGIAA